MTPIKILILTHPDMPSNQGIIIDEISLGELELMLKEYEGLDYPSGIPKFWAREGADIRIFPSPKDSEEFEKSGYKLAIIRETKQ